MSFHIVYVTSEPGSLLDGPPVATTHGFTDFGSFVEYHASEFPYTASFVEHGQADDSQAGTLDALAKEIGMIANNSKVEKDIRGVATSLLTGLQSRPANTVGVIVTDGEVGEDVEGDVYG